MQPLGAHHKEGVSALSGKQKLLLRFGQVVELRRFFQIRTIRTHQQLIAGDVKKRLPILLDALG